MNLNWNINSQVYCVSAVSDAVEIWKLIYRWICLGKKLRPAAGATFIVRKTIQYLKMRLEDKEKDIADLQKQIQELKRDNLLEIQA